MKNVTKGIALALMATAVAPSAWAQTCDTPLYNTTIDSFNSSTPNDPPLDFSIGGTGIIGDNFTACRESPEIELGLRINNRAEGLIVPVANNRYVVIDGAGPDGNMPWNVDVHIDMGFDYGTAAAPNQVSDLDSLILQYDCEPAIDIVSGPAYDLVALAGFFPLPLVETTRLIQLSDNILFPGRCLGYSVDPDADGSYEFSLTANYGGEEVGHVSAVAVNGEPPEIAVTPPTTSANFSVIKTFEDGNLAEVEVSLDCNTGLILDQDKVISPWYSGEINNQVTFVVTELGQTAASCTVFESDAPAGYTPEYTVLAGVGTADEDGCHFEDVVIGTNVLCGVTNRVDPVDVVIVKEWVGLNDDEELIAAISLQCENVIPADAQSQWVEIVSSDDGDGEVIVASVKPSSDGSTFCEVEEQNYSSAVEVSGCEGQFTVSVGQSGAGCTLINSVFYEGIPTLNQYGIALLALLMLGMGFVGFRRFV
jgi:hypothetical protein